MGAAAVRHRALQPAQGCCPQRADLPALQAAVSAAACEKVRERLLKLGVSQVSGASRTSVGGYTEAERPVDTEQFDVSDQRTLDEVIRWLIQLGKIPSFCTACYREGRTGDKFMSLCKTGHILNCCQPNALITLKEFLVNYATNETKKLGEEFIQKELAKITNEALKNSIAKNLTEIEKGNRDFKRTFCVLDRHVAYDTNRNTFQFIS